MNTPSANAYAATILVDTLVEGGVQHAVLSPGSRNTPLVLAFDAHPAVACHMVLDERAAGFIALGLARQSGRPVAMACTSGTAGAHYYPALIEASESGIALIAMTADRPPELHGCGSPQTINQHALYGEHVRFSADLDPPHPASDWNLLRTLTAQALRAAIGNPSGPVHINAPFREPLWSEETLSPPSEYDPIDLEVPERTLPREILDALTERLSEHPRGVIVCGPRCPTPGHDPFPKAVFALASMLGWPILAEPASGLRYGPYERSSLIPSYDALLRSSRFAKHLAPTCFLQFGGTPVSKACREWMEKLGNTILIDPGVQWSEKPEQDVLLIDAEPTALCLTLLERLKVDPAPRWSQAWTTANSLATDVLEQASSSAGWEGLIARSVLNALPNGAILHVANSMPIRDLDGFALHTPQSIHVHANRGVNGIDGTLSTALGENLARPEQPTVALLGDLAFLHDSSGVLTAGALAPNLTVVVIQNNGGGIFGFLPIAEQTSAFERLFVTPQQTSFSDLVVAAGGRWTHVKSTDSLSMALIKEIEEPGLGVLGISVDREENIRCHQQAWRSVQEAIDKWLDEEGVDRW